MKTSPVKIHSRVAIEKCYLARSFFARFMGLMGRKSLPANEAILFPACNSIHTLFMRFPIDVVSLDAKGKVVKVREAMGPWRVTFPSRAVKHTLELRAFQSRKLGIHVGAVLEFSGGWI